MGLFKKKKQREDDDFVCESPTRGGQAHGNYRAQQNVARLKETVHQDQGRPSTEKHSLDTEHSSEFGDADIKSSRLKVRLRKSLSQMFADKTQSQRLHPPLPRIFTEVFYLKN